MKFYPVLLAVILWGTISAAEKTEKKRVAPLSFFCDINRLRGLYTALVKSRKGSVPGAMSVMGVVSGFFSQNQLCIEREGRVSPSLSDCGDELSDEISDLEEEADESSLLFLLLPNLLYGRDESSKKAIEEMKISFQSANLTFDDQRSCKAIIKYLEILRVENEAVVKKMKKKTIDGLTNSGEYSMELDEKKTKNSLLECDDQFERVRIISMYVMSQYPRDLQAAFKFFGDLKHKSDDRKFIYESDSSIDEDNDNIELTDKDYEMTLPLLGTLIGAIKQVQDDKLVGSYQQGQSSVVTATLKSDELADLAEVKYDNRQKFHEGLKEFLRGIEPMEKEERSFLGNLCFGKYMNKKRVILLGIGLGTLCLCYKYFFHQYFFSV